MGRLNLSDLDHYKSGGDGAGFFKLADDGDTARVRFMIANEEDLNDYIFAVHDVEVPDSQYPKPVSCLRKYNDPISDCPFCEAGYKTSVKLVLPLYDVDDNSIKMWTRGRTFISKMTSLCSRYKNLVSHTFDIERVGSKGDQKTSYEVYETGQDETELEDLPEIPDILGDRFILEKSAEDMEYYLESDEFPPVDEDVPKRRRSSSDDEEDEEEERPRRRREISARQKEGRERRTPAKDRKRSRSKEDKF